MSGLSEMLRDTVDWFHQEAEVGQTVIFNGVEYDDVLTERIAGMLAGESAVPRSIFGVDVASTSPREFRFPVKHFKPWTDVYPPINGNIISWNGWDYRVTDPDVENMADDSLFVIVSCLRHIGAF